LVKKGRDPTFFSGMNWMEVLDQNLKTPMTTQRIELLREYGRPSMTVVTSYSKAQ
jgi:hypothetical protein